MTHQPLLFGICGAPCTGKTTLSRMASRRLTVAGYHCEVLPELARILTARGVKIDDAMGPADYDAFLHAYDERDAQLEAQVTLADRTPIDHYSYLAVNENAVPEQLANHQAHVLSAIKRYNLLFYLPIHFRMRDDGFRNTDPVYQEHLDNAIRKLLNLTDVPVVTLGADKRKRARLVVELIEGQLQNNQSAIGASK